jgi:hypothetical protein
MFSCSPLDLSRFLLMRHEEGYLLALGPCVSRPMRLSLCDPGPTGLNSLSDTTVSFAPCDPACHRLPFDLLMKQSA